jgi:hypothetical protein
LVFHCSVWFVGALLPADVCRIHLKVGSARGKDTFFRFFFIPG